MEDNNLGRLGELLLLRAISRRTVEIRTEARAHVIQAAFFSLAVLMGAVTLILGLVMLYMYLVESMSPLAAVGWIAGGFLLLTIFLWLMVFFLPACHAKSYEDTARDKKAAPAPDATAAMIEDVTKMIAEHPVKASLSALAAGAVIGYFPEVRSLLVKVLAEAATPKKPEE